MELRIEREVSSHNDNFSVPSQVLYLFVSIVWSLPVQGRVNRNIKQKTLFQILYWCLFFHIL